jgi:RNase P subunit RPR2
MRNKKTMNCNKCGKMVSIRTAGEIESERSDLDGVSCVVTMWCKQCAANRRISRSAKLQSTNTA